MAVMWRLSRCTALAEACLLSYRRPAPPPLRHVLGQQAHTLSPLQPVVPSSPVPDSMHHLHPGADHAHPHRSGRHGICGVFVVSVAGGTRDYLVETHLTALRRSVRAGQQLNVLARSVHGVASSVDHNCLVWCSQLVEVAALALVDITVGVHSFRLQGRSVPGVATLAARQDRWWLGPMVLSLRRQLSVWKSLSLGLPVSNWTRPGVSDRKADGTGYWWPSFVLSQRSLKQRAADGGIDLTLNPPSSVDIAGAALLVVSASRPTTAVLCDSLPCQHPLALPLDMTSPLSPDGRQRPVWMAWQALPFQSQTDTAFLRLRFDSTVQRAPSSQDRCAAYWCVQ